jgi:hypothetical protein
MVLLTSHLLQQNSGKMECPVTHHPTSNPSTDQQFLPPELPWLTHLHHQFPDSEHLLSFFNSHLLDTPVPGPGAYTVYV